MQECVLDRQAADRPEGFDAAYSALKHAILSDRLEAQVVRVESFALQIDWFETRVAVDAIQKWLRSRGIREGFFFAEPETEPSYLDEDNSNYAPKLAAAVSAWTAVSADETLRFGKSVKQALMVWLRAHANEFGLTKEDGNPNEQGIEEIAKIANWDTKGGAPKIPF